MDQRGETRQANVAVVDDDPALRNLFRELFRDANYVVHLWDGIEDSLTFIERSEPDVLILDNRIGQDVTIWSVLDQLGSLPNHRTPHVLVCSADATFLREHERTLRARSCGIIEKPFDIDELMRMVEDCLTPSRR